jgi:beta-barrel assembly-enhancing protease
MNKVKKGKVMRTLWLLLITLVLILICGGCQTNPVTGEEELILVSPEQEKEMGRDTAEQVEKELGQSLKDQQLQSYINSVGQSIAQISHMPSEGFSYKAIDHKSVNAFALPGGYIYITSGLLKELNSEAQLAAILAHETAHVTARHLAQQITRNIIIDVGMSAAGSQASSSAMKVANIVRQLEGMSFTREQERQADEVGLDYLVKAGYTPYGIIETMEILQRQSDSRTIEFFSTHPNPENRIGYLQERIYSKSYRGEGKTGQQEYAANVLSRLGK